MAKINMKQLAEFVEEGLTGLGVIDDADELMYDVYKSNGMKGVKKAQAHYNNAIEFVNQSRKRNKLSLITDEELAEWLEEE